MDASLQYHASVHVPGLIFRIWNRLAGVRDRNGVLGQFYKENNVSPEDIDSYTFTKQKYYIQTHHLERLANRRDREVNHELSKVEHCQELVKSDIKAYRNEVQLQKDILAKYKKEFTDVDKKLKNPENSSQDKAYYQGLKGTVEASIENQASIVANYESHLKQLEQLYRQNVRSFKDGLLKENASKYEQLKGDYLKYAGKKLLEIGFTKYAGHYRELPDETAKRIEQLGRTDGI